jgi:hypothetical protein
LSHWICTVLERRFKKNDSVDSRMKALILLGVSYALETKSFVEIRLIEESRGMLLTYVDAVRAPAS